MSPHATERRSHSNFDIGRRRRKAEKIAQIVASRRSLNGLRVLRIGCASGVISSHLAQRVGPEESVPEVDVVDKRAITDGFEFQRVDGVVVPFPDQSVDPIVANQVMENLGTWEQQRRHLREIARVLCLGGFCYLAVPNRWVLHEPHFRLWFLNWSPRDLHHAYGRAGGRGEVYDCKPPGPLTIRRLIADWGRDERDITHQALRLVLELEGASARGRAIAALSDSVLTLFSPVSPTLDFVLTPETTGSESVA